MITRIYHPHCNGAAWETILTSFVKLILSFLHYTQPMVRKRKKNDLSELDIPTLLKALDRLHSGFAIHDKDFGLLYANKATRSYWPDLYTGLEKGLSQREAVTNEVRAQFPDKKPEEQVQIINYCIEAQNSGEAYEIVTRDGRVFRTHHETIGDGGFVAIGIDLTDIKSYESRLKHLAKENLKLANKDELTGLSNRRYFSSHLDEFIENCAKENESFSLGLLDLDGFKLVNDIYGHPAGDDLLIQVAQRLTDILGEKALVTRLGGDEYGFIIPSRLTSDDLEAVGQKICKSLAQPYYLKTGVVKIAASIGLTSYPSAGNTRPQLFEKADFALYQAKQNGKNCALIFSEEHEQRIRRRSFIELKLREKSIESELRVVFQPIFGINNSEIAGMEALARWDNPQKGVISPAEFIPIAEQSGQMQHITPVLLRKALAQASHWPDPLFLTFNLSAAEVSSVAHANVLLKLVAQSPFPANRLIFEITETATAKNIETAFKVLKLFRDQGIRVALDDFGSGYSSLSLIAKMPLDMIKIDRSFLNDIGHTKAANAVLRSVADLSHHLELTVVIEGVETDAQYLASKLAGVELIQGHLFSEPVEEIQVGELLEKNGFATAQKLTREFVG